jgi:hypothetical protein
LLNYPNITLDHERFHIVPRDGAKKLAIFFTGSVTGDKPKDRVFHFWKVAHDLDPSVHLMFINNGSNQWYQGGIPGLGHDVHETVAQIGRSANVLGASDIYCIGGSMGGHGASLYGALLGARILAFGCETILKLPHSRSTKLMVPGFVPPLPDLAPILKNSRFLMNLYCGERDPVDLYCAAHVKSLPSVRVTTLRSVAHGPPGYLHARGRLLPMIRAFLADEALPICPEAGDSLRIDGYPEAYFAAHCAAGDADWARLVEMAAQAVALNPISEHAHHLLGRGYLKLGRFVDALAHFATASKLARYSDAEYHFGYTLRHLGRFKEAELQYRAMIRRWPHYADAYAELAVVLKRRGNRKGALALLKRAVALAPNNGSYAARLARMSD